MLSYYCIYISKSWSIAFIVVTLQLSRISINVIILFSCQFSYNFFNSHLFFLIFTLSLTFLILLPFHLSTTLYLNITIYLFFHLPLFCLFLFTLSYYKFVILCSILCIVFPHKNVIYLSLSLSLSIFCEFLFLFLFFLHLCFRLINFCIF